MTKGQNIQNWIKKLEECDLPQWNELPNLDLYMDQVITLMEKYLSVYKKSVDKLITPSMINNYVKLGVIPKPSKKRYSRIHLAYLIMVCSLKQVMPISEVQKLVPLDLTEKEVETAFNTFREMQKQVFSQVTNEVANSQQNLSEKENTTYADFFQKAVQVALTGNIYKILSALIVDYAESLRD